MHSRWSALVALMMVMSAGAGMAQTQSAAPGAIGQPTPAAVPAIDPTIFANARQGDGDWLATNFINHTIYGPSEEKLGKIIDMMFDAQGRPTAAIVGVGGFLGIGEKNVAITFGALKRIETNGVQELFVSVTKAQLKSAPRFVPLAGRP